MAQRKISELPELTAPDGAEELVVNDSGVSKKVTVTNIVSNTDPKVHTHTLANITDVTSTAAELNILNGVTSTVAELNYLDITTLGTQQASKAVTTNASNIISSFESTGIDDNATSTAITIDANENVSIGTSSPDEKLHVYNGSGDVAVKIESSGRASLSLKTTGTTDHNSINFGDSGDNDAGEIRYTHSIDAMQFDTSGAERMHIDSSGNVGIGTSSPSEMLHLQSSTTSPSILVKADGQTGNTTTTAELILSNGSLSTNDSAPKIIAYRTADYSTAALRSSGLKFQTTNENAAVTAMTINNNGNVGIGTSSPNALGHFYKAASGRTWAPDSADILAIENNDSVAFDIRTPNSDQGLILFSDADARGRGVLGYSHSSDAMYFNTAGSQRMRIDSSGNVGIGTSSPRTKLHIAGSTTYNGTSLDEHQTTDALIFSSEMSNNLYNSILQLVSVRQSLSTGKDSNGYLGFSTIDDSNGEGIRDAGRIAIVNESSASRNSATALSFWTNAGGTNTTAAVEKMRIDSSGKVGIGTDDPSQMLHLKDHTANDGPIIRLEGDSHDTAGNLLGGIEAYNADPSGDGPNVVSAIKFLTHEDIDHGGQLAFYTHDGTEGGEGSAPVERMRIDNNGNVGIGVTPESDWNSLGKIIQLAQTSSIGGYTASSLWLNENCKYTSSGWEYINSDLTSSMWLDGGMIGFRVAPSGTADTAISWNTAMTIDNNGQVNICDQSSVTGADLTVGALGLASNITRSIEELSGHGGTVTASGNIEIDIFYGSQSAASTLVEIEIMAYSGKYLSYKHGSYWGTNWSGPHNNTVIENANSGFTVTYDTNPTNAHEVFTITNSAGITYPVIRVRALCGGHVTSTNPQITFTYTES